MATMAPDPSTLTSSADIFSGNHTLPQIRSIHKSLHVAIEEKSTRLRTQVGSSYRELLGTADTIVQMRSDNEQVQGLLGEMGRRCGRSVVNSKAAGLAKFVRGHKMAGMEQTARAKLLDNCGLVVGRILKGGGGLDESFKKGDRLVLAAKVLILARLLGMTLGDDLVDGQLQKDVEAAKKTLSALRRRLLRSVERVLEAVTEDSDREDVLKALCAYSLATSSGARDVLRHFLHVRQEAMVSALAKEKMQRENRNQEVIRSLRLYARTLLDVQALVPTKLFQALAALKSRQLFADPALKQLSGLRLDIYESWCGDEIQCFTPFIRHDDLDGSHARDMLTGWAEQGGHVLVDGVKTTLAQMSEFKSIMELRTSLLQLWIRDGGRARGFDPSDMQGDLRNVINVRMLAVLEAKVRKLHVVGSEIEASLKNWGGEAANIHRGLWDDGGYNAALANGATALIEEVTCRLYGRSNAASKVSHCYSAWFHVIDDVKDVVQSLKKQRWDNDFDEVEDEDTIEDRQQALSKEDPQKLEEKLDASLDNSYRELDEHISSLWEAKSQTADAGAVAMYLLRVLRDMRNQLPERPTIRTFGLDMVPSLHKKAVESVSKNSIRIFTQSVSSDKTVPGRPLWDGEPALPGQPSPIVFEFLRNLSTSMSDAGVDIWTPTAVVALKLHLDSQLSEGLQKAINSLGSENISDDDSEENQERDDAGEDTASQSEGIPEDKKIELHIQWLFDISFLRHILGDHTSQGPVNLEDMEKTVYEITKLDKPSLECITKASGAFWQRTKLLFGLLA